MGGGDEEEQLQAHQVQQHLLAALQQGLLQERVQQPSAEGQRCAVAVHLQPQHQGEAAQSISIHPQETHTIIQNTGNDYTEHSWLLVQEQVAAALHKTKLN